MNLAASLSAFGLAAILAGTPDGRGLWATAWSSDVPEVLIIDMNGDGICLSSVAEGVSFRFEPKAPATRTAWTCGKGGDAFVATDFTTNGRIDGSWEMVGGRAGPWESNGLEQLTYLDGWSPKTSKELPPIRSGRIDAGDWIYPQLALWIDENHDGITQEKELESAAFGGVLSIALGAKVLHEVDGFGNTITRRTTATIKRGTGTIDRQAVTVRLKNTSG